MPEAFNIRVNIAGADTDGEVIALSTQGILQDVEDGWTLRYTETNPDDMTVSDTHIRCTANDVTVSRGGTVLTTLVFREGETFFGDYETPFGNLQLRMLPTEVSVSRRGLLGHIHLVYQVTLSNSFSPSEETSIRYLDIRFVPCRN